MRKLALLPLIGLLAVSACGGDDESGGATTTPQMSLDPTGSTTTLAPAPSVEVPAELPTELEITDLEVGEGRKAKNGDILQVRYVGVRSEDGTEFDSNFDAPAGFEVTLGAGGVIEGWDKGLVGVQAGGVRQLDIPSDLAYGDQPRGEVIKAGDALTFVIQVDSVLRPPNEEKLVDRVPVSDGVAETTTKDLVEGTGAAAAAGDNITIHLIALRGDNKVVLENTWSGGQAIPMQLDEEATLPGFVKGITGMKVGGRRIITMTPDDAFGPDGQPQMGLPRETDFTVVVDLVSIN